MNPKKIVITGGPGTGKTSVIKGLENAGYTCFHEVIRDITLEAKNSGELDSFTTNPIALVSDAMGFNKKLLEGRVHHYKESLSLSDTIAFFDRGIPDILAYMDYFNQKYDIEFTSPSMEHRYDTVFLLPMWESIYTTDNERFESYEEALEIQKYLLENYTRFGYNVIEVPKDTVINRIRFILEEVNPS